MSCGGSLAWGFVTVLVAALAVIVVRHDDRPASNFCLDDVRRTPLVTVEEGSLLGHWVEGTQAGGFQYAAFSGVPYAKPPLGPLRFKGPRPADYWDGVRLAVEEAEACVQDYEGKTGSEDCLYLNVYTPSLPNKCSSVGLPVYVFLHGGGYIFGSASAAEYGPDFLLEQGVVVVTVQYRLGAFGFLSLDTEDVPGNAGLKDQVAALRWVRRNVARFGGDPDRVTLGGHAVGAVSADWLSLLPATKGLFQRTLLQSGSAVHSFSYQRDPVRLAMAVARQLQAGSSSSGSSEVLDAQMAAKICMAASERDLHDAGHAATVQLLAEMRRKGELGAGIAHSSLYNPSPERRVPRPGGEDVLITRDAESYMLNRERADVPVLFGQTTREMAYFFPYFDVATDNSKLDQAVNNLVPWTPPSLFPSKETREILKLKSSTSAPDVKSVAGVLRKHFFEGPDQGCNNTCRMAKLVDEVYFVADSAHFVRMRAALSKAPTYVYSFSLQSDYNQKPRPKSANYLKDAVMHGDDLGYTWRTERARTRQNLGGDSVAAQALRRQVVMWADFIKRGDPTPSATSIKWPALRPGSVAYLDIGEQLTVRQGALDDDLSPWQQLFTSQRHNKSP